MKPQADTRNYKPILVTGPNKCKCRNPKQNKFNFNGVLVKLYCATKPVSYLFIRILLAAIQIMHEMF